MRFIKLSIVVSLLFYSMNSFSQKFANTDSIQPGMNNAFLQGEITLEMAVVPAGTEIAAFNEQDSIVGWGEIEIFSGKSFFNFAIFGNNDDREQQIPGECFRLSIFLQSENDSFDVEVESADPRLCSMSSSLALGDIIKIDVVKNSSRFVMASNFGPYISNSGAPMTTNWDGFGSEGALNLLPVTYSSISITNQDCKQVSFDWTTSSEINNEGFYVERKVEGDRSWEQLDFIEGNGTSYEEIDYRFIDTEIAKDKSLKVVYYRLKQIDFDGRVEYSDTKSVRLNCGNSTFINVYPNPVYEKVNIEINKEGLDDEKVTLEIHAMNGQLVSRITQRVTDKETLEIQTGDFAPGIYSIQAFTNNLIIAHTRFTKN